MPNKPDQPLIVVAAVVTRDDRLMICRRPAEAHNGLKWEFPGGKMEPGESPQQALAREMAEELDVRVQVDRVCDVVYYRYPDRDVLVLFYRCRITQGHPRAMDGQAIEWASPESLPGFDFAGADRVFVDRLTRTGTPGMTFGR